MTVQTTSCCCPNRDIFKTKKLLTSLNWKGLIMEQFGKSFSLGAETIRK